MLMMLWRWYGAQQTLCFYSETAVESAVAVADSAVAGDDDEETVAAAERRFGS